MTQEHATAAPVCYRHPDRHTLLSCSRCGRPICGSCSVEASVGQRCPDCARGSQAQTVVRAPSRQTRSSGAPATVTFIAIAVVFYLASNFGALGDELVRALAQVNVAVAAGEWWRLFTPVLLHASFTHLLFNMWALWVLGPQVEREVGTSAFVALFVASAGVGGAFAYYFGDPLAVGVGASGAIFGLFGVWLNLALHRRNSAWGRAMLGQLGFLLLINAALPFIIRNISWQAHLGGLLAGFLIAEIWRRIRGPREAGYRTLAAAAVAVLAAVSVLI